MLTFETEMEYSPSTPFIYIIYSNAHLSFDLSKFIFVVLSSFCYSLIQNDARNSFAEASCLHEELSL